MQCNPIKTKCLPTRKITNQLSSLDDIVEDYIIYRRPDVEKEFKNIKKISTDDELIRLASFALQSDNKRNSHHYRKSYSILQKVYNVLKNEKNKLLSLRTFEEVYEYFERKFSDYVGIRELYFYDTSLMICANKNIFPKYIYLHSGTKVGARNLGLSYKEKYLTVNQIPEELRRLKPYEIEDVLCIYKEQLQKFKLIDGVQLKK